MKLKSMFFGIVAIAAGVLTLAAVLDQAEHEKYGFDDDDDFDDLDFDNEEYD